MPTPAQAKDRLIFALDVASVEEAHGHVKMLNGVVSFFKVGGNFFF